MVTLSPQAKIALDSLMPADRQRVERQVSQLEHLPNLQAVRAPPNAASTEIGNTYLVRVSPKLQLLFRREADSIEVLDIFGVDRLEQLFRTEQPTSA